jgi:hypothetical protein
MINSTKKRGAMSAVLLMATLLFSVGSAQAQSRILQVTIPFDFYTDDTLLPAGNYEATTVVNNMVRLYNPATGVSKMFSTMPLSKASGEIVSPKLIFNKYGENHFLAEMWWGGGSAGIRTATSKRETELAKNFNTRIEARAQR